MTSLVALVPGRAGDRVQNFFWTYPYWWAVLVCGFAWVAMLRHGWIHFGHEIHHAGGLSQETGTWLLMVAAMMLPAVFHKLHAVVISSLWKRRHRAMAGFLAGYFASWLLVGVMAAAVRQQDWARNELAVVIAFAIAALWGLTPACRRALVNCHSTRPLAPTGWRADRDCLRFGWVIGTACVASCGPLMLGCALSGHALVAMVGGFFSGAIARGVVRARPIPAALPAFALCGFYAVRLFVR